VTDARAAKTRFDELVGTSGYMTLATADSAGDPWASPVWFASVDGREFLWVSSPDARHSQNIAARPEVAIAIFDSRQPPGTGAGAYIAATATQVADADVADAVATYSRLSLEGGAWAWTRADVRAPARLRLFRAVARERWILSSDDERLAVP
jgi:pyridoxine/pyridoxamine 5'-phosphate oxidase